MREFKTGTLVEYRERPWVVQKSQDKDVLMLKPLGGTDAETTGVYLPLYGDDLKIDSYNFKKPAATDLQKSSYASSARLLYHACRLSFRDIAGPFQCLGRLSFRPRPYQMVPLIMALQQEGNIRLLIGDDVGIGKTLESLLIAKELLDRKEINRFAVLCLPHLCEQWQKEIKDKFGLDAVIVRGSTVSALEKNLRNGENIFRKYPFQVISIDYIKSSDHKNVFLDHCPEFIIVDEAHTCAKPKGALKSQQLRYALLNALSKLDKHILLLTATPHSGQEEEFQSLIGLLNPAFESIKLSQSTTKEREALAKYFIQRRRSDIMQFAGDNNLFPTRVRIDDSSYRITDRYAAVLDGIIQYAQSSINTVEGASAKKQRYIYWDMLALIRGVMSSPQAGIAMLNNKLNKKVDYSEDEDTTDSTTLPFIFSDDHKDNGNTSDVMPEFFERATSGRANLKSFIEHLQHIIDNDEDAKVRKAISAVEFCLSSGMRPIVFCQFIETAEYLGRKIEEAIKKSKYKKTEVRTVTSRLADEQRKIIIEDLAQTSSHILVCTDCLSEGVNLQDGFEAVIHYDLPWNPNRLEQRNGRIDRFGQSAPEVMVSTIYASNNPVDDIILNVLYAKQEEIRRAIGVYLPIAEDDSSVMESIMKRILVTKTKKKGDFTGNLFEHEEFEEDIKAQDKRMELSAEIEKVSRSIFAHNNKSFDPTRLEVSLKEVDDIIGDVDDTADFCTKVLSFQHVPVEVEGELTYSFNFLDLPERMRHYFKVGDKTEKISFLSPTPKGYTYIGRNHTMVEDWAREIINDSVNGGQLNASRAMVTVTDQVDEPTTILLMRVRSVIRQKNDMSKEIIGEEMIFIGYEGKVENKNFISKEACKDLFLNSHSTEDISAREQEDLFNRYVSWIYDNDKLKSYTDPIALERAEKLVDSYTQYRTYVKGCEYVVVEPVLPMDVIAAYVYLPED